MQTFLRFLALWLVLLGVAAGIAHQQSLPPAPAQPPALAPRLGVGVGVALEGLSPTQRGEALDAVAAAGFRWVRQRIPWEQVEPTPGDFRWEPWDALIADVRSRGLELVAVLDGSPAWARAPEDAANPLAPPSRPALFGPFARSFAQRYRDQVRFVQVWDEPNIAPHWGSRPVSAGEYAALLREAAVQIRDVHPTAVILAAALAPNVEPGGQNQSDLLFLEGLYRAGAAEWFDAAAGQAYGFAQPPQAPPAADALNFRRPELLRRVMEAHGDAATPLWVTAFGWHAGLDGQPVVGSPWESVEESLQARWATEALDLAHAAWPWLGGVAWVTWQPAAPSADLRWGFALASPTGRPRAVGDALAGWLAQPRPLGPGAWPLDAAALSAVGPWRRTALAADPPHGAQAADGNRLVIPFQGTGLALEVQPGPFWAYLDVTVDGQPANALPRDGRGRANLVLYDPLAQRRTVTVARGLPDGPHVAELAASGGWDQWPLRAAIVLGREEAASPRPRWPWTAWALIGLGAALLALSVRPIRLIVLNVAVAAVEFILVAAMRWSIVSARAPVRFAVTATLLAVALWGKGWWAALAVLGLMPLYEPWPELSLLILGIVAPLALVTVDLPGRSVNAPELFVWLGLGMAIYSYLVSRLVRSKAAEAATGFSIVMPGLRSLRPMPLDRPVAALVAVAAASLLVAQQRGVAIHEFRTVIVAGALAYALVRVVSPTGVKEDRWLWPTIWGIGLGATVVAVWGIGQAITGQGLITAEGVARVRGPYGSPNNLALYLGHALPIFLAMATLAVEPGQRLLARLVVAPVLVALVLTFSKGALLLGLPAAVLAMGLAAGGRRRRLALLAVLVWLAALLPLFRTERFAGLLDLQAGTTFFRLQLWRGAWNMAMDHPWLGVGLDNFLYAYRTIYVPPAAWQELNLSHPHNILLDFWTRLGLVGVAVGVWLFAAAFASLRRTLARVDDYRRAALIGLLGSLTATLAHGLIDNSVFLPDLMLLFMLTLGLLARTEERLTDAAEEEAAEGSAPIEAAEPAVPPPVPAAPAEPSQAGVAPKAPTAPRRHKKRRR